MEDEACERKLSAEKPLEGQPQDEPPYEAQEGPRDAAEDEPPEEPEDEAQEGPLDEAADEPPDGLRGTGACRWHPGALWGALLAAAIGAGILAWTALFSYRVFSDTTPKGMNRHYLPGIRIDLPAWEPSPNPPVFVPGTLKLTGREGVGYLVLRWCPGHEHHSWDFRFQLLDDQMTPQGHSIALAAETPVMLWHALDSEKKRMVAASWLCLHPYVRYYLHVSLEASWEALIELAKRVLSSVRCSPGTLDDVEVWHLPVMRAGSRCAWGSYWDCDHYALCPVEGIFFLTRGVPGALELGDQVAHVREQLGDRIVHPPDSTPLRDALHSAPPRKRIVHRLLGVNKSGASSQVLWTLFHCAEVDQTFFACYLGPVDEDERAPKRRLEGLQCPSRLPAHLVLDKPPPASFDSSSEEDWE